MMINGDVSLAVNAALLFCSFAIALDAKRWSRQSYCESHLSNKKHAEQQEHRAPFSADRMVSMVVWRQMKNKMCLFELEFPF